MLAPTVRQPGRISLLQPTAINAIFREARACQAEGKELISLMRGEPDLATPPHVVEACARALRNGRTSYPGNRGERNFRSAVSEKLLRDNNLQFDPETEILATTGATFGMLAPEGGFFAMADVRGIGLPSNEIRKRLMREHGVVVVHGAAYGPGGEGTLRVSFASGGETLAQGLQRLREGLEHLS